MEIFKTKLSNITKDIFLRNDVKYHNPDIIISLNGRNDIYLASKGYLVENFNTEYSKSIESQINFINNSTKT